MEETGQYVKIGYTKSIEERIEAIQSHCPYTIYLIDSVNSRNASLEESELHKMFEHLRHRGEWFKFDYTIIEEFNYRNSIYRNNLDYIDDFYDSTEPPQYSTPTTHYQSSIVKLFNNYK